MPININGTTGIDSPGYTQAGDPVVESGSNTDGEWTRWADGTQQCAKRGFISNYSSSAFCTSPWTFPLPFSSLSTLKGFADRGNSSLSDAAPGISDVVAEYLDISSISSGSAVVVRGTGFINFQSGDLARLDVMAIGRWK